MKPSLLAAACALALAPCAVPAQVTVTLSCDRDNTLYESANGSLSNGSGTRIFAGVTLQSPGTWLRRALVHFDVAGQIPAGSTVTAVEFEAAQIIGRGGARPVFLHALTSDWGEGASAASGGEGAGAPAQPGDATWLHRFFPNQLWTTPGGDFVAQPSGSNPSHGTGTPLIVQSSAGMVADVQSWLDQPGGNFGWLIKTDELQSGQVGAYESRESGAAPLLRVTFEPPASVTPFGTGCGRGGSAPLSLAAVGLPTVPNAGFLVRLAGGPATIVTDYVFVAVGGIPSGIRLPNRCRVYVDPTLILGGLQVGPTRDLPLPVPNQPSLLGAGLILQGVSTVPGTLVTSNGLDVVIGR